MLKELYYGELASRGIRERLEGLGMLIGLDLVELRPTKFPTSFQVPVEIHDPAYEALQQTLDDGRERHLEYNYGENAWRVDVEVGPKELAPGGYRRSRSLPSNIYHSTFKRPLISLHTHPRVSDEDINSFISRHHPESATWSNLELKNLRRKYRLARDIGSAFPSHEDVKVAHARFPKELVQMLYTPFSSFMMVRNNLSGKRQGKHSVEWILEHRETRRQYLNTMINVANNPTASNSRERLLNALSVALGEEYSLFYSLATPIETKAPILTAHSND